MKDSAGRTTVIALISLGAALVVAATAGADSIFDSKGMGRGVIPAVGSTRALGGAVAANLDPLSVSLLNPCAAARARYVILAAGFANTGTGTDNIDQKETTLTTIFTSLGVTIPVKRFALMTGLFQEREGRVSLADTGLYSGTIYDAGYVRETSIHSVPLVACAAVGPRLVLSAGILFSYCDMREESIVDFRSEDFKDTDDVMDTYAAGRSFLGAFALDLGRAQLGGVFRTGPDLEGKLERSNSPIGLWRSQDISISSKSAFRLGLGVEPLRGLRLEGDYDRTPWAGLALAGERLNDDRIERWSLGIQYRADYVWPASRYPLNLGYRREPLDWQGGRLDKIRTGRITEEVFSIGTSIPIGQDRASVGLAFEFGTRKAAARPDIEEKTYTLSVSVSAMEAWRKELKR